MKVKSEAGEVPATITCTNDRSSCSSLSPSAPSTPKPAAATDHDLFGRGTKFRVKVVVGDQKYATSTKQEGGSWDQVSKGVSQLSKIESWGIFGVLQLCCSCKSDLSQRSHAIRTRSPQTFRFACQADIDSNAQTCQSTRFKASDQFFHAYAALHQPPHIHA